MRSCSDLAFDKEFLETTQFIKEKFHKLNYIIMKEKSSFQKTPWIKWKGKPQSPKNGGKYFQIIYLTCIKSI